MSPTNLRIFIKGFLFTCVLLTGNNTFASCRQAIDDWNKAGDTFSHKFSIARSTFIRGNERLKTWQDLYDYTTQRKEIIDRYRRSCEGVSGARFDYDNFNGGRKQNRTVNELANCITEISKFDTEFNQYIGKPVPIDVLQNARTKYDRLKSNCRKEDYTGVLSEDYSALKKSAFTFRNGDIDKAGRVFKEVDDYIKILDNAINAHKLEESGKLSKIKLSSTYKFDGSDIEDNEIISLTKSCLGNSGIVDFDYTALKQENIVALPFGAIKMPYPAKSRSFAYIGKHAMARFDLQTDKPVRLKEYISGYPDTTCDVIVRGWSKASYNDILDDLTDYAYTGNNNSILENTKKSNIPILGFDENEHKDTWKREAGLENMTDEGAESVMNRKLSIASYFESKDGISTNLVHHAIGQKDFNSVIKDHMFYSNKNNSYVFTKLNADSKGAILLLSNKSNPLINNKPSTYWHKKDWNGYASVESKIEAKNTDISVNIIKLADGSYLMHFQPNYLFGTQVKGESMWNPQKISAILIDYKEPLEGVNCFKDQSIDRTHCAIFANAFRVKLTSNDIARLKKGNALTISSHYDNNQRLDLDFNLKGFNAAISHL